VYDFVSPAIKTVVKGFNCTVFAYGQTGSGKTFTMFGTGWEGNHLDAKNRSRNSYMQDDPLAYGIIPRSVTDIFTTAAAEKIEKQMDFTILCSFLQIYNEKIYDLLQDNNRTRPLNIREDATFGIYVEGLAEYVVQNLRDCITLIKRGDRNRAVRATRMNQQSSRSHTILQVQIETDKTNKKGNLKRAKLNLCDLAGSEKFDKSVEMTKHHLDEMNTINLSLTTLGKVISSLSRLSKDPKRHIPYRESKLTRLLQDSLGGNTKTCFIATVSPIPECLEETVSTLKFADRARQIRVNVQKNEISATSDKLVMKLQREIQYLKEILQIRKHGSEVKQMQQRLWMLQEENLKLKEITQVLSPAEVLRLKEENKQMKIQLQKLYETGPILTGQESPRSTANSFEGKFRSSSDNPQLASEGLEQPAKVEDEIDRFLRDYGDEKLQSRTPPVGNPHMQSTSGSMEVPSPHIRRSASNLRTTNSSSVSSQAYTPLERVKSTDRAPKIENPVEIRFRGKGSVVEKKFGFVHKNFEDQVREQQLRAERKRALDRLRTLEQIELYKEARAKDAIKKLEEERAKEIENLRKQEEQVAKKSQYVSESKKRFQDIQDLKRRREMAEEERRRQEKLLESVKQKRKRLPEVADES
jgi:hypothetical protein